MLCLQNALCLNIAKSNMITVQQPTHYDYDLTFNDIVACC